MDPAFDHEARRLFASAALSTRALRRLGGRVPAQSDAGDLLRLARRLGSNAGQSEPELRLHFEPPYPGVTAGPQAAGCGFRLLLACAVSDREGRPLGVAFTALIPGRSPQVSVAPPGTPIPEGWSPPEAP